MAAYVMSRTLNPLVMFTCRSVHAPPCRLGVSILQGGSTTQQTAWRVPPCGCRVEDQCSNLGLGEGAAFPSGAIIC